MPIIAELIPQVKQNRQIRNRHLLTVDVYAQFTPFHSAAAVFCRTNARIARPDERYNLISLCCEGDVFMRLKPFAVLLLIAVMPVLKCLSHPAALAEDVVEIGTFEELAEFSERVARGECIYARAILTADIRASRPLRPIGTTLHMFSGEFDGQGHAIFRLIAMSPRGSAGLFGCVGPEGVVKNVSIERACVAGRAYAGGVAGYCAGRIESCRVTDSRVACLSHAPCGAAGGVAGLASGRIENCAATRCDVRCSGNAGGVCGAFYSGVMRLCAFAGGSVYAGDEKGFCGGLAGSLHSGARMRACIGFGAAAGAENSAVGGAFSGSGATGSLFVGPDAPPFQRRLAESMAASGATK